MSRVIFHEENGVDRPVPTLAPGQAVQDAYGRPLRDLRISVTDRCNFRCRYCMPREVYGADHVFLPRSALLTFEEITRVARIALTLGVRKIRLTGGEPLMRKQLDVLVGMLAELRTPDGAAPELTLTTNGALLARQAAALARAGLNRVTVSLDAMDDAVFQRMSDGGVPVADILAAMDAAVQAGLQPVKVNMVVRRGMNDDQILPMARHFRHSDKVLRFIEYMDVGHSNGWRMDEVVTGAEIIRLISAEFPLVPVQAQYRGEVASRWCYADGAGEIGLITSVSQPFCGDCTRLRLSPEGKLFTCLFADHGHDLRELIRTGADDAVLAAHLSGVWLTRKDRYSEQRGQAHRDNKIEMSYIGG
ncbi:MAG: GTP 3',8-cyclase MoaA [Castellaniella sp.]|uniref:GTP 3',8-cyclase MoaA n=1 Tax=Castellaniella sp. TaxID=1955812 RepID=UPI0012139D5A|nr:GTP 3',8-cyclase MoaA [Castellaniella sp.]TAN31104.1 MAG: GTP 3',8-cyclase MoaA [Castellaniella sp.]